MAIETTRNRDALGMSWSKLRIFCADWVVKLTTAPIRQFNSKPMAMETSKITGSMCHRPSTNLINDAAR